MKEFLMVCDACGKSEHADKVSVLWFDCRSTSLGQVDVCDACMAHIVPANEKPLHMDLTE